MIFIGLSTCFFLLCLVTLFLIIIFFYGGIDVSILSGKEMWWFIPCILFDVWLWVIYCENFSKYVKII